MRGIIGGDIFLMYHTYIFFGARGGIEGPTFVMSCFVERPVSVPSCLETGGTLKTSLYLCDKESYRSVVYIFLWVFFLLHIVVIFLSFLYTTCFTIFFFNITLLPFSYFLVKLQGLFV